MSNDLYMVTVPQMKRLLAVVDQPVYSKLVDELIVIGNLPQGEKSYADMERMLAALEFSIGGAPVNGFQLLTHLAEIARIRIDNVHVALYELAKLLAART